MKNTKKLGFLLILIPLGFFIRYLDLKVFDGFLADNQTKDHFKFIGVLVGTVAILLAAVLYFDKKSNS
ncbi:MAG: hypothetical protein ACON42_01260 [Flavobacteriaceae bacterium]